MLQSLIVGTTVGPPKWIKPQLTRLVDEAPTGTDWLHEIKYDGYRMHARRKHSSAPRRGCRCSYGFPSHRERSIRSPGSSTKT
jgi:ATP-dependent DNA ligase